MRSVPANTLFSKVGLDIAGPLPLTENGNRYILNIVCWFSKFVVSVPLPDTKSLTVAKALLSHVYFKFGGCTELISDNATTFTSEFFKSFCNLLYINKTYSTPYWSQGNSVTERVFRTFHNVIAKYIKPNHSNFDELLDAATFCYNTATHETTGESPFFMVFGRDPIFSVDQILDPNVYLPLPHNDLAEFKTRLILSLRSAWTAAAETTKESQNRSKIQYDKRVKPLEIKAGDKVFLRNYSGKPGSSQKYHFPWKGIFRVIGIDDIHAQIIPVSSPQSNPFRVHLNQLKKVFESPPFPSCTHPRFSMEEKAALKSSDAEEMHNIPGYDHQSHPRAPLPTISP